MSRKILINGQHADELRVAIVDNHILEDYEIEAASSGICRNNIYRGVVVNIAPSLNAAFVDFGEAKHGFLAFNDVVESVCHKPVKDFAHAKMSDLLVPGQVITVQVIKDAQGFKGAQVTTNISLAGRYLVLRPKDAKSGVSRKVDDDARADLTQKAKSLDLPEGCGCIVRTNALDQPRAILLRDAKALVKLWQKIDAEAQKGNKPQLLYNDQDLVVQAMRDYFDSSISEVLIDDKACYERALAYVHSCMPNAEDRIKFYQDRLPLFTKFDIERQIDQIFDRNIKLPSGGFIVIDPTEALTAIDVNSSKSTKRESQDLTAYHTNLEAAVEIARQLRLRDIGGLIVVDFIDMRSGKHQRDVERVMRNAMSRDKARNKVERISANGLLEINRQRISQALSLRTHLTCPTCGGRGYIPTTEMLGRNILRQVESKAIDGKIAGVNITLNPEVAIAIQNERRQDIFALEQEFGISITIFSSDELSCAENAIEWIAKPLNAVEKNTVAPDAPVEVASIIDVEEEITDLDDNYRPNDYEEYASDSARQRRQLRRQRRNQQAAETAAVTDDDQNIIPEAVETAELQAESAADVYDEEAIRSTRLSRHGKNDRKRHRKATRTRVEALYPTDDSAPEEIPAENTDVAYSAETDVSYTDDISLNAPVMDSGERRRSRRSRRNHISGNQNLPEQNAKLSLISEESDTTNTVQPVECSPAAFADSTMLSAMCASFHDDSESSLNIQNPAASIVNSSEVDNADETSAKDNRRRDRDDRQRNRRNRRRAETAAEELTVVRETAAEPETSPSDIETAAAEPDAPNAECTEAIPSESDSNARSARSRRRSRRNHSAEIPEANIPATAEEMPSANAEVSVTASTTKDAFEQDTSLAADDSFDNTAEPPQRKRNVSRRRPRETNTVTIELIAEEVVPLSAAEARLAPVVVSEVPIHPMTLMKDMEEDQDITLEIPSAPMMTAEEIALETAITSETPAISPAVIPEAEVAASQESVPEGNPEPKRSRSRRSRQKPVQNKINFTEEVSAESNAEAAEKTEAEGQQNQQRENRERPQRPSRRTRSRIPETPAAEPAVPTTAEQPETTAEAEVAAKETRRPRRQRREQRKNQLDQSVIQAFADVDFSDILSTDAENAAPVQATPDFQPETSVVAEENNASETRQRTRRTNRPRPSEH